MASLIYPAALPIERSSQLRERPSSETFVTRGGSIRQHRYSDIRIFDMVLVHGNLTTPEKETLESFYESALSSATGQFSLVWPWGNKTLTCVFTAPPQFVPLDGYNWKVSVQVLGRLDNATP